LLLCAVLAGPAVGASESPVSESADAGDEAVENSVDQESGDDSADKDEKSEPAPLVVYEEIEVKGRADDLLGIATSSSEGVTGRVDLERRPILRPAELVETAPGIMATQHSGGGKANQYFLRGFNLDHGTDFSVWVEGVPVNMPTHGHGQGYADLNFLIPEIVDTVGYRKGPYHAEVGDFSTAGFVSMEIARSLPKAMASITGGNDDYGRLLYADSFTVGDGDDLLVAVEGFHEDGPWRRGDDYEGAKGALRYARGDASRGWSLTAMGYDADWLATDQLPRRAVEEGLIDRFGLIDPGPRGETTRASLAVEAHRGSEHSLQSLRAFLISYDFTLFSDFTIMLDFPDEGDLFEQRDERWVGGVEWSRSWARRWNNRQVENRVGVQVRADEIDNGLFRNRQDLERFLTVREDDVELIGGAPWIESDVRWNDWFRTMAGVRLDFWSASVDSDNPENSGSASDELLSPKLSFVFGPWSDTELYVNLGYGFHSNDARGATIRVDPVTGEPVDHVDPLVRTEGIDVGVRSTAIEGLNTSLTLFQLELDSELVFVGDAGATEAGRPSRRRGVELAAHYTANDWLGFEVDATYTDAEFTDHDPVGELIPGSIEDTLAAAINLGDPDHFSGSLRWRYFADIPLIEDGSARWGSASSLNGRVAYRFDNGLEVMADVFNILDTEDSDIEYFYASRLPGESEEGVEDVHFHPMIPRSARVTLGWRW
jgi:outer membrane receptor protein involved in Fe transport